MFRREPEAGRKSGLIRSGVRGISGVVGLASEGVKAYKRDGTDSSLPSTAPQESAVGAKGETKDFLHDEDLSDDLENDWALDEAGQEIDDDEPPAYNAAQNTVQGQAAPECNIPSTVLDLDAFLAKYPAKDAVPGSLPIPVILPQRRPKNRSRGFIRAYAPFLQTCGISQQTWLSLLSTLQRSSMADPWLNAINLAGFATMAIPHGFGILVGIAIQQITAATIELQGRYRTSKTLDALNEGFFRPRGLCALVLTWNPRSGKAVEKVDISETIASSHGQHAQENFRSSDGVTYGDPGVPEGAPLVFPALDRLEGENQEEKKSKLGNSMAFVQSYWDRRARAEYAAQNPSSVLTTSAPPQDSEAFTSRYADPNNAASSGSLISFVSGGKLIPGPHSRGIISGLVSVGRQAARGEKQGAEWERYNAARTGKERRENAMDYIERKVPVAGSAKRLIRQDVLYLMVINLPKEEEMVEARELARKVMQGEQ